MADMSEYEAKRLRRIEENREKLQALNLPILPPSWPHLKHKKRKRNGNETPPRPSRTSSRGLQTRQVGPQDQPQEPLERDQQAGTKHERKERHQLVKGEKTVRRERKRLEKLDQTVEMRDQTLSQCANEHGTLHEQVPYEIQDWRLRRKVHAQAERRQKALKRREERKAERDKEHEEKKQRKVEEREREKEEKARRRLERFVRKEVERQQRYEEHEMMRHEDAVARAVATQEKKEEKKRVRLEKAAAEIVRRFVKKTQRKRQVDKKIEDLRNHALYSVRQVRRLPFVRIAPRTTARASKPSARLSIDPKLFHGFSLGKQFVPPGKDSVMQGLCPGGSTVVVARTRDLYVWKNALTLFVNGTTGMFYRHMFEDATLRDRKFVFFRWSRCDDVTPWVLKRLRRVHKGEEWLRFDPNYYDSPEVSAPDPLLLFLQYPKGPYIYCGRLGYLGHRSNPLEFSFQLLDSNALNWKHLWTLLTAC